MSAVPESVLPSQIRGKSKSRTAKALPVIDHNAQREKLKSIISLCDDDQPKGPPTFATTRGKSNPAPARQQAVKNAAQKGAARNSSSNLHQKESHSNLDQAPPKVARVNLVDRQKEVKAEKHKPVVAGRQPEPRKRALNHGKKPQAQEVQQQPPKSSAPSKWLATVARQNYSYLAQKLDMLESKKRVAALRTMRKEFKRRVNLIQSLYRHKKFGEQLPEPEDRVQDVDSEGEANKHMSEVWKELGGKEALARLKKIEDANRRVDQVVNKLLQPKKQPDEISDFGAIEEDSDEQEFGKKEEALEGMHKSLLEKFLLNEVITTAESVQRVHRCLQMWVHRRRYLQRRQGIIFMQTQYRLHLWRKQQRRERLALLDEDRLKRMEIYCRHFKDKHRLNGMAARIQREIMKRIRRCQKGRDLRKKLKEMPFVVRNGFVKMEMLKQNTQQLHTGVLRLQSAKGGRR